LVAAGTFVVAFIGNIQGDLNLMAELKNVHPSAGGLRCRSIERFAGWRE